MSPRLFMTYSLTKKPAANVIQTETSGKYHLLAANGDVTAAEIKLMEVFARENPLASRALEPVRDYYDFIFIDCPPSLNLLTVNAMAAADSQCWYLCSVSTMPSKV